MGSVLSGVAASFDTVTSDGFDRRTYGLQAGTGVGGTPVEAVRNGSAMTLDVSFTKKFDVWIVPNYENFITLQVVGSYYPNYTF